MAIGKSGAKVKENKLSIFIGPYIIYNKGKIDKNYNEEDVSQYMKNENIVITVDLSIGQKFYSIYNGFIKRIY